MVYARAYTIVYMQDREGMRCTYVGYVATYVSFRDTWRSHLNFPWESYVSPTSRQPSLFSLCLSLASSSFSSFLLRPSLRIEILPLVFSLRLRRISNVYQRCRHGCREGWGKEGASISFSPSLSLSSTTIYIKIIVQGWCRFRSPVSPRDSLSFPPRISIFFFTFIVTRIRRDWRSLMDVFDSETVSIFDSLIQTDLYRKRLYLLKSKIDVNRFLSIFINRREIRIKIKTIATQVSSGLNRAGTFSSDIKSRDNKAVSR